MSNEMISVPRELLFRVSNPFAPNDQANARAELRALLAKPAAQHQGEPVDALLLDDCVEHRHPGYGGGYFGTEVVKLYARPAEQPAPVAVASDKQVVPVRRDWLEEWAMELVLAAQDGGTMSNQVEHLLQLYPKQ